MTKPLDERYFTWLYSQVGSVRMKNPSRTYWFLLRQLYKTEFVWLIPNDDNRVEDGRDLRYEFAGDDIGDVDPTWLGLGCSMLEMMIGVSRRLAFEAEGEPRDWFWQMVENLDLRHHNDVHCTGGYCEEEISNVVNVVIWRTYLPSGRGGLFPLDYADHDQRDVEIWYQLSAYILERG